MGLPVRSLHDPSVQSSNRMSANGEGANQQNKSLQELIAEEDQVESELKALGQVLDSVRTLAIELDIVMLTGQSTESI